MKNKILIFILSLLSANALAQAPTPKSLDWSVENFLWNDFNSIHRTSLETHTLPSKVALTSLVLVGREKNWISKNSVRYQDVLKLFGFQQPTSVQGASKVTAESFEKLPAGLIEKKVTLFPGLTVTGLNVSCAACHGGHTYDSAGNPTSKIWPGLPNTSLNLEAYVQSVSKGMNIYVKHLDESHRLMLEMFPETPLSERLALKTVIYPTMKKRLAKIAKNNNQVLPFSNGSPGLTNGVSALKFTMGFGNDTNLANESGFTSIPALGDRFLRSSLLYDGSYMPTNAKVRFTPKSSVTDENVKGLSWIVSLFTIPSMGQTAKIALTTTSLTEQVLGPLVKNYKSPQFPGEIDIEQSHQGEIIYQKNCAQCHGTYDTSSGRARLVVFPNRLSPQSEINSDPKRWQAMTPELVEAINKSPMGKVVLAKRTGGYVAPILNSLWATAPYLHNGSVPTLWDLMNPDERPSKFLVGGHSLDLEKVGILLSEEKNGVRVYPSSVKYASVPVTYNTSEAGKSNSGHEAQFKDLSQQEKRSLLEFLKRL